MDGGDLYALLGVERSSTAEELRAAYRRLARQSHPDVNPTDSRATERFLLIHGAYETLSFADRHRQEVAGMVLVFVFRNTVRPMPESYAARHFGYQRDDYQ